MHIRAIVFALLVALCTAACGGDVEASAHIPYVEASVKGPNDESAMTRLRLHDDLGDIELWVYAVDGRSPAHLPLDTSPRITFFGRGANGADRVVALKVRDEETNPDEDGQANVRDGSTHYFIYPFEDGENPEDNAWLCGKDFECEVQVEFNLDGATWVGERFTLVPHTHSDGHGADADHTH